MRVACTLTPAAFRQWDKVFLLWQAEVDEAEARTQCRDHTNPGEHMFGHTLANQGVGNLVLLFEVLDAVGCRIRGSTVDAVGTWAGRPASWYRAWLPGQAMCHLGSGATRSKP